MENVGDYLKRKRTERGLTQEQLASGLKVSRATINKWEAGTPPGGANIWGLCNVLNISPYRLTAALSGVYTVNDSRPLYVANTREYLPVTEQIPGDLLWKTTGGYIIFFKEYQLKMNRRVLFKQGGKTGLYSVVFIGGKIFLKNEEGGEDVEGTEDGELLGVEGGVIQYSE